MFLSKKYIIAYPWLSHQTIACFDKTILSKLHVIIPFEFPVAKEGSVIQFSRSKRNILEFAHNKNSIIRLTRLFSNSDRLTIIRVAKFESFRGSRVV